MNTETIILNDNVRLVCYSGGHGPLVVVLPSIGRGVNELCPFAEALVGGGMRVILPEPRGIAGSLGPSDFTLYDLADDIAAVIDVAGGTPAIIAGHAFGNWVARMTATRHPQKVCGIVLLAAAARNWPRSIASDIELCSNYQHSREERLAALQRVFFAGGNDPQAWLDGWHGDLLARQRDAAAKVAQSVWWTSGIAPILDLQAAEDPLRPQETADELFLELPDRVTVKRIPGASHALPFERPKEAARAVLDWLSAGDIPELGGRRSVL
ncbi:alpha/beta fold hydrolase [Rhizobium sp. L1K21]|uniref:alpha/beta fold hydrolase n=1 Tax=Rhizobium sp. L1K21 TaxID=2954933 RepID=UPI00209333EA|nr:alpha/beta hydrolase [Rhizobium sp. L1K21]MCO6188421.1 alpha/beta hydrolase [Rhizobium sp. L1K21]